MLRLMKGSAEPFSLRDIMDRERLTIFFQPIINLKTGSIFAYEALVRGIADDPAELIPPRTLFAEAEREELSMDFDRLCRKKALEAYGSFDRPDRPLMFLNINTSEISYDERHNPHIHIITRQMGFSPRGIGLELIESPSKSAGELIDFVNRYRESGFVIVIDDFGCEHSNIDRLIQIHPDIIKIDRNVIAGIEKDTYRQSILKSIHSLAEMTGSLCLAEGVETLVEIKTCQSLGVDLFQGFAIARPAPDLAGLEERTKARIEELQEEVYRESIAALRSRRRLTGDINMLADWLIRQIDPENLPSMAHVFEEFIAMNREIECIFILDASGRQVFDTVVSPHLATPKTPTLFAPAAKNSNHRFKPYFTCFEALKVRRYLTDVYLSQASGNLCRTFSVKIGTDPGQTIVLCMDFMEESIRTPYLD